MSQKTTLFRTRFVRIMTFTHSGTEPRQTTLLRRKSRRRCHSLAHVAPPGTSSLIRIHDTCILHLPITSIILETGDNELPLVPEEYPQARCALNSHQAMFTSLRHHTRRSCSVTAFSRIQQFWTRGPRTTVGPCPLSHSTIRTLVTGNS
jgi:hypothetical protein